MNQKQVLLMNLSERP